MMAAIRFKKEEYAAGFEWWYEHGGDDPAGGWFITPPMEGVREDKSEIEITLTLDWLDMPAEDWVDITGENCPAHIHFVCTWENLLEYGSTVWMHGMQGSLDIAQSFERLAAEIRKRAYERRNEKCEL